MNNIKAYLQELDFNSNEIETYLALTKLGEASAAQIAKSANLPRTTVISILEKLKINNYCTAHKYHGLTYYWVESPRTIVAAAERKLEIAGLLNEALVNLYRSEAHFPFAEVFDTKESIKKFIERALIGVKKNSTIYTIDTPHAGNYAKIFSDHFNEAFLNIKRKKNIQTNTLIPYNSFIAIDKEKLKKQNIRLREMPPEINFEASLWIIDGFVVHFSGKPPFITAIRHDGILKGVKGIYDFLWDLSAPKN
jgi:sugar-specific transcriptional regulator TrmB